MSLITIEPGALPDNVTPFHLERMPLVAMVAYVERMGAKMDGLHVRRRNVGDLTMNELAARGCETDEARETFLLGQCRDVIRELLDRDMQRTCLHEETYRGGAIWEICSQCGAKWADDEGGKPEWEDPAVWSRAENALSNIERKAFVESEGL